MLTYNGTPQIKLSYNNSKIKSLQEFTGIKTACFDLPAGWTCPASDICRARVNIRPDGSRFLEKFASTKFTCYATKSELCYTSVYNLRWSNFYSSKSEYFDEEMSNILKSSGIKILRLHSSGDFYNPSYFQMWFNVALLTPDVMIFGYTKLPQYVKTLIDYPLDNFKLVYSIGGRFDDIARLYNLPSCTVVCPGDDYTGDVICSHDKPYEDYFYIMQGLSFGLNVH